MNNIGKNLQFAVSQSEVDKINSEFYSNIKYPWPPITFEAISRRDLWTKLISQDLGYWTEDILPQTPYIWVAGCGTNQAIVTALKFPNAQVIGSDVSQESLALSAKYAKQLNIKNLELKHESINDTSYISEFDYIIATGVIHHNAKPHITLQTISRALKPRGILELMVYNKFHRIATSAFQLAVRTLAQSSVPNLPYEMALAKKIVQDPIFRAQCKDSTIKRLLDEVQCAPDAAFADALLQPVEHSYTIESLNSLIAKCDLEILHFCLNQFSVASGEFCWNLRFQDHELQNTYDKLLDTERWQITNLLCGENSPMLWFYLQNKNCTRRRKSEQQICQEFLNTKFKRIEAERLLFARLRDGTYDSKPISTTFPTINKFYSQEIKELYYNINENESISKTFERCKLSQDFNNVNITRLCLTTSANPFLESV